MPDAKLRDRVWEFARWGAGTYLTFFVVGAVLADRLYYLVPVLLVNLTAVCLSPPLAVFIGILEIPVFVKMPICTAGISSVSSELCLLSVCAGVLLRTQPMSTQFTSIRLYHWLVLLFLVVALVSVSRNFWHLRGNNEYDLGWEILLRPWMVFSYGQLSPEHGARAFLTILEGCLVFFIASGFLSPREIEKYFFVFLLGGIGIGCVALAEFLLCDFSHMYRGLNRVSAAFRGPNDLGFYMSVVSLCAYAAFLVRPRLLRFVLLMVCCLGLLVSFSRGAWLACLIAGMLISEILPQQSIRIRKKMIRRVGTTVVCAFLSCVVLVNLHFGSRKVLVGMPVLGRLFEPLDFSQSVTQRTVDRNILWSAAFRVFQEYPIAGAGVGRLFKILPDFCSGRQGEQCRHENAHNYFLQVAAELGLLGIAPLMLALILLLWRGLICLRSLEGGSAMMVTVAAGGWMSMLAMLLHSLVDHQIILPEFSALFWFVLGLNGVIFQSCTEGGLPNSTGK